MTVWASLTAIPMFSFPGSASVAIQIHGLCKPVHDWPGGKFYGGPGEGFLLPGIFGFNGINQGENSRISAIGVSVLVSINEVFDHIRMINVYPSAWVMPGMIF